MTRALAGRGSSAYGRRGWRLDGDPDRVLGAAGHGPAPARRPRGSRGRAGGLGRPRGRPGRAGGAPARPGTGRPAAGARQRPLPPRAVAPRGRSLPVGRRVRALGRGRGGEPRALRGGGRALRDRLRHPFPGRAGHGRGRRRLERPGPPGPAVGLAPVGRRVPGAARLGPGEGGGGPGLRRAAPGRRSRRRCGRGLEVRLAAHAPHSVSPALLRPPGRARRAGRHPPRRVARRGGVPGRRRRGLAGLPRAAWPRARRLRAARPEPGALRRPPRRAAPAPRRGARRPGGRGRSRDPGPARRARGPLPAQQPPPRRGRRRRRRRSWPRACASPSAPTAWPAPRRSTSWTTPCCCTGSSRGLDPARHRAHGDARRGRGARLRRPRCHRAGEAGRAGLRPGVGRRRRSRTSSCCPARPVSSRWRRGDAATRDASPPTGG